MKERREKRMEEKKRFIISELETKQGNESSNLNTFHRYIAIHRHNTQNGECMYRNRFRSA